MNERMSSVRQIIGNFAQNIISVDIGCTIKLIFTN